MELFLDGSAIIIGNGTRWARGRGGGGRVKKNIRVRQRDGFLRNDGNLRDLSFKDAV